MIAKYSFYIAYILLVWLAFFAQSCIAPNTPFKPEEVKRRVLDSFPELRDTIDINVVNLSQNAENQWFVAYNKGQAFPRIFLYHTLKKQNPPIKIDLARPLATIEFIELVDVTYDGEYEMLIHLYYDYETSFQGRETVIVQNPFDSVSRMRKEIFHFQTEQVWQKIDTFVDTMGLPVYQNRVENEATLSFFENYIVASGIIAERPHRKMTFEWNVDSNGFALRKDEILHEAAEEEQSHHHAKAKLGGQKKLVQVVAHERDCRSFVVETLAGDVVDLPKSIHDALLCSDMAAISPKGDYLVYADHHHKSVRYYHFGDNKIADILPNLNTLEGVSDVAWWANAQGWRLAFVVINPEEYVYNTRICVVDIDKKGGLKTQFFDKKVWYQCYPREGVCKVEPEHIQFSANGNLVYKQQNTGNLSADLGSLELQTSKKKTQK